MCKCVRACVRCSSGSLKPEPPSQDGCLLRKKKEEEKKRKKNPSQWLQWNLLAVKDGEGEEGKSEAGKCFSL